MAARIAFFTFLMSGLQDALDMLQIFQATCDVIQVQDLVLTLLCPGKALFNPFILQVASWYNVKLSS